MVKTAHRVHPHQGIVAAADRHLQPDQRQLLLGPTPENRWGDGVASDREILATWVFEKSGEGDTGLLLASGAGNIVLLDGDPADFGLTDIAEADALGDWFKAYGRGGPDGRSGHSDGADRIESRSFRAGQSAGEASRSLEARPAPWRSPRCTAAASASPASLRASMMRAPRR